MEREGASSGKRGELVENKPGAFRFMIGLISVESMNEDDRLTGRGNVVAVDRGGLA